MHRQCRPLVVILLPLVMNGCLSVGQASPDEKQQLDAWAKVVTPRDRDEVTRQASQHTEWAEKKKVQWMTQQYKARYNRAQTKKAATRAATQTTTRPSSGPFGW
jgi:hypothetical protein